MKARHLQDSLDAVVESCVNFVGVDVNAASPALLRYVSGMNQLTARRVYEYRRQHGPFKSREQLKEVPGFGDSTFVQAAGFLKIYGGDNPLDATWIHPESYDAAQKVLDKLGSDLNELAQAVPAPVTPPPPPPQKPSAFAAPLAELVAEIAPTVEAAHAAPPAAEVAPAEAAPETIADPPAADAAPAAAAPPEPVAVEAAATAPDAAAAPAPEPEAAKPQNTLAERAMKVDAKQLAQELSLGEHLLRDILSSLKRPGLDPRENLAPPVFRRGVVRLEDLQAGMELSGTVLNVVDFGAFVDIGLSDSGLVHISRLADRYIRDPHEVVSVGDILKVWVIDIDKQRRRVSLTAIAPGSERPQQPRQEPRPQRERPARPPRQAGGQQPAGAGQQQQQRPPRPQRQGGGRRDQRPRSNQPTVIERKPTKPKPVKPITKKMEEGKEPMRSFSDLAQLFDKKKEKKKEGGDGKS
jgi:uncharacterized protein